MSLADARHLPAGRSRAGDRHLKIHDYRDNLRVLVDDDYPIGLPSEVLEALLAHIDAEWGSGAQVDCNVPSRKGDDRFAAWYAKYVRSLGTPTTIVGLLRHHLQVDVRSALARVRVPTLVLHRRGYAVVPFTHGRYLSEHIAGATLAEIDGTDGPMYWEGPEVILDHLRAFVAADAPAPVRTEIATILFTDIVRSTERAESLGDREWGAVVAAHRDVAGALVEQRGGRVVKWTGDGILAVFADPDGALGAAGELSARAREMGVPVRAGLHTGRVELTDGDVQGLAVHIAARVVHGAGPDEVVVSRTVRDLVLGTGHRFHDRGRHHLKGVDGEWDLYTLEHP